MGKVFADIDARLADWIARQPVFFVGTAPLAGHGHVNVSPKGPAGSLRILDPTSVAYLDVLGSGAETAAHVRENGRIVIMLCAFAGPPRVVRLHGRGELLLPGSDSYDALLATAAFDEPSIPAARRAIVRVDVTRVADACGYGVPLLAYQGERPHLAAAAAKRVRTGGTAAVRRYQSERNAESLDGLPALPVPAEEAARVPEDRVPDRA